MLNPARAVLLSYTELTRAFRPIGLERPVAPWLQARFREETLPRVLLLLSVRRVFFFRSVPCDELRIGSGSSPCRRCLGVNASEATNVAGGF